MTNETPNNITTIESRQPAPSGAKFIIAASVDGFPVSVEVEGKADTLRAMIDRLKAIGAEPPNLSAIAEKSRPTKPEGPPLCPIHHKPMKASQKPGKFYCPRRSDDGEYCRETA